MAHWFHRNPLKATSNVTYEMRGVATNGPSQKICSESRQNRNQLLELLINPSNQTAVVMTALNNYLSLLHGFITAPEEAGGDSKLRYSIRYRWTNTLLGNTPTEVQDCVYERISIIFDVAVWFTKHASVIASKDEPKEDEAKEVHKCLRTAAGMFALIKNQLAAQLIESPDPGTDLDPRVLDAYIQQCTAEAQEITIARAIELKHNASLIAALANETAQLYTAADSSLKLTSRKETAKWQFYLQFKAEIYLAYAYNYHGETLLAQDKCGDAIKCLEESQAHYTKAIQLAKSYASTKGAGTTARPQEHLFFRKLGPVVQRTLDKCVRENGFIYHQKVPAVVPELELKATYGLVSPEEFTLPSPSLQWSADVYKAYDLSKLPTTNNEKSAAGSGAAAGTAAAGDGTKKEDIPAVNESTFSQSTKDPNNSSGCVVS